MMKRTKARDCDHRTSFAAPRVTKRSLPTRAGGPSNRSQPLTSCRQPNESSLVPRGPAFTNGAPRVSDNHEKNAYSILGLHKGATPEEIKMAYVELVKKFDPERHTERFMTIQHAFDRLKEPALRAKEDVRTFNYIKGEFLFGANEKTDASEDDINKAVAVLEAKKEKGEIPAAEADPKLIQGYMLRSYKKLQKRLFADANQEWQRILALDPTHRRAKNNLMFSLIQLGYSYANHELYDEAIEVWSEAARMNPDSDEMVQNLSLACEHAGRHGEARRYWEELLNRWRDRLEREPNNDYLKSLVIEVLREHVEAEEEERPEERTEGGTPIVTAKKVKGVAEYREILQLNPDDFEARFRLAGILMHERQWQEAIAEFDVLRKKFPRNIEVMNMHGWALLNNGKVDDAFMAWRKARTIDPKNPQITESLVKAHMAMGRTLRDRGLFTASLTQLKALLKYLPTSDEVHYEIGKTFAMKGDESSAFQEYTKALELNPKNREARHGLSALKLRR